MIAKIQRLFERVVASIEQDATPLSRYFHLFGAILAVRLMLEFYSNNRRWELDDVLHISLWFTFIVLAFLLQLKLFSGEKLERVAKLVVVCFTIALTAPIIDLLFFGGKGIKMNYLAVHSWQDVLWSYVTIGGSSLSRGATLGIRVEIFLLVIASFNYIRTKTGNWIRAFFGTFCIYTVLFFSGTLPTLMSKLVIALDLQFQEGDNATLLFLLWLDLMLLCAAIALHASPEFRKKLVLAVDPWVVLIGLGLFSIGFALGSYHHPERFAWTPSTLFFPAIGLIVAIFMMVLHALHQLERIDNESKRLHKDAALWILAIASFALGGRVWFLVMVWWGCGFLLEEAPLKLRLVPVLSHLIQGLQLWVMALAGWTISGGILIGYPVWVLGLEVVGTAMLLFGLDGLLGRSSHWNAVQGMKWVNSRYLGVVSIVLGSGLALAGGLLHLAS